MSTCRKQNVHNRQPPEQHKNQDIKQFECKMLQKQRRPTETRKYIKGKIGVPPSNGLRQMPLVFFLTKLMSAQLHPYPIHPLQDEQCK